MERVSIFYEIGRGKHLCVLFMKSREMSGEELGNLLSQLLKVINTVRKFMLDAGKILFDPGIYFL